MAKKKQKNRYNRHGLTMAALLMFAGVMAFLVAGMAGREYYYTVLETDFCAELFSRAEAAVTCSQSLVEHTRTNLYVTIGLFFSSGALIASSVILAYLSTRQK